MRRLSALLASAALAGPLPAAADTFVLVHGAFQDASGWDPVASELEAKGHRVLAVDLPGRDATGDEAKAVSLENYVETVAGAVASSSEPVILVGHSFGGMTVTVVADRMPDAIDRLVYVAAYVPQSGESMETLALSDGDNRFTRETFVIAGDYSHAEILAEDQVRVFAQDADAGDAERLRASMIREPLAPIGTPVEFAGAGIATVDKAYVRTLDDGTVSTPLQSRMIERAGIKDVVDIQSGHAPFLTRPSELAAALDRLSK